MLDSSAPPFKVALAGSPELENLTECRLVNDRTEDIVAYRKCLVMFRRSDLSE